MPLVERKQVYRWFVDGKGYANAPTAYKTLAKRELMLHILQIVDGMVKKSGLDWDDEEGRRELVLDAFGQMFPPCGGWCCLVDVSGYIVTRKFCVTARKAWIKARAEELRREDQ